MTDYITVPREPTPEQIQSSMARFEQCAAAELPFDECIEESIKAALAASPKPEAKPVDVRDDNRYRALRFLLLHELTIKQDEDCYETRRTNAETAVIEFEEGLDKLLAERGQDDE